MNHTLVKLLGWKATVLHGDPSVYDRWRWLKKHLEPGDHDTLDAGCGNGCFSLYAATIGNNVVGVDFGDYNISVAQDRAKLTGLTNTKFVQGDLRRVEDWGKNLGTFDQILCFEAIEHIMDDQKLINNLSRLLRPGGKLFLTTPYKHYKPLLGDQLSPVEDGGHVRWGYTHEEMLEIFQKAGLKVVVQEYISGVVSQQLINTMRIVSRANSKIAWSVVLPLRLFQAIDTPLTKFTAYPHLSIGVVGEKRSNAPTRDQ